MKSRTFRPDSILFDLDGTLWDATTAVANGKNEIVREFGYNIKPITKEDVAKTAGLPAIETWQIQFPEIDSAHLKNMIEHFPDRLERTIMQGGASLYPGVKEGLEVLSKDFRIFIVSNCTTGYLDLFLKWSNMSTLFEDTECWGRTKKSKSDNITEIVKKHSLRAPIYVGDTEGDQLSSEKAGIPYLHMDYGFGTPVNHCQTFVSFNELVLSLSN